MADMTDVLMTLRQKLAEYEDGARRLREAIALLEAGTTGGRVRTVSTGRSGASTSELAREIIDSADRDWPIHDVYRQMYAKGWETTSAQPLEALRASLERLAKLGQIERREKGIYGRVRSDTRVNGSSSDPTHLDHVIAAFAHAEIVDEDDGPEREEASFDPT